MTSKSGKEVGQEYLVRIQTYLDKTTSPPMLGDGSLNISAIAAAADVPRQSLYKNPAIRRLLDDAKSKCAVPAHQESEKSESPVPASRATKQTKALERRLTQLEQQNAALVAENAELRRQLKATRLQMGREDMVIESGRRIPSPPADA